MSKNDLTNFLSFYDSYGGLNSIIAPHIINKLTRAIKVNNWFWLLWAPDNTQCYALYKKRTYSYKIQKVLLIVENAYMGQTFIFLPQQVICLPNSLEKLSANTTIRSLNYTIPPHELKYVKSIHYTKTFITLETDMFYYFFDVITRNVYFKLEKTKFVDRITNIKDITAKFCFLYADYPTNVSKETIQIIQMIRNFPMDFDIVSFSLTTISTKKIPSIKIIIKDNIVLHIRPNKIVISTPYMQLSDYITIEISLSNYITNDCCCDTFYDKVQIAVNEFFKLGTNRSRRKFSRVLN